MSTSGDNISGDLEPSVPNENQNVSIAWRNLRFETGRFRLLRCGNGHKVILNRLNGSFKYHTLNAFMGPSGAGKTTLLNCLSGNLVRGLTEESEIYLNKTDRFVLHFVEQYAEKRIAGELKVGEIFSYSYRFKNRGANGDMERHIRTTIDELLLDEKVLGRKFEQCSGGEQKRIAIAQELMSLRKPTLLFVDEPTTGLDSNAAHLLMQCLKQLATKHRMTVVTSIHVPSDDILNLFDKLYVLAKGGVCIYSGRPEKLRIFLETKIPNLVIPEDQPPIEVLTKIACNGINDPQVVSLSDHCLSTEFQNLSRCNLNSSRYFQCGVPNRTAQFHPIHLYLQFVRLFRLIYIAQINRYLLQVLITTSCMIYMSTVFNSSEMVKPSGCLPTLRSPNQSNQQCSNNVQLETDLLLRQNIYFLGNAALLAAFTVMNNGASVFGSLVAMFNAEHRNHWYSVGVFYWSSTIVELIQLCCFVSLFLTLEFFVTGQHSADNYRLNWLRIKHYVLFNFLLTFYAQSLGHLLGIILWKRRELSLLIVTLFSVLFITYSGFLVDLEQTANRFIFWGKELLQFNSVIKGIVYTFYGVDRCDVEKKKKMMMMEYSLALQNYHVDTEQIWNYALKVLINTGVVRLLTLIYLYLRFGCLLFRNRSVKKSVKKLPIDYETCGGDVNVQTKIANVVRRDKTEEEVKFEKFTKDKIIVAWKNLTLFGTSWIAEVTSWKAKTDDLAKKAILNKLSGEFRFGTLNAVMGTSGVGKTSLLKVLNGRDKTRICSRSQFYLSKFTRIQTCFITQDVSGHLLPGLTAKQTLVYASRLKNAQLRDCETSQIDHQQIALSLLEELGLSDTVDTLVEKCSGGERKRLALAAELTTLQMPNLICIDEPTSGLDSNSAEVVVSFLRKLTKTHSITIVTSIHQPNTELLRMFDQIYVLARGGVCIYSGSPTTISSYLRTVPEIYSPNNESPIETLIKNSCNFYPDPIVLRLQSTILRKFTESIVLTGLLSQQTQLSPDGIQQNRRHFSLKDTWILCVRYLAYVRGHLWKEWLVYIGVYFGFGLFILNLFDTNTFSIVSGCITKNNNNSFQTCFKSEENIAEENNLLHNVQYVAFAFGYFLAFVVVQLALLFTRESVHFDNEHRNGWYSTGSFYLCKSLLDLLFMFPLVLAYCLLCNIYQSVIEWFYLYLISVMLLATSAFSSLAYLVSILTGGHPLLTSLFAMVFFVFQAMLNNFFVPITSMHYVYRLLANLSINRFVVDSLLVIQYGFGRCEPNQIQPLLQLFSLRDSDYQRSLLALALIAIVGHLLAFTLLVYRSNQIVLNRSKKIPNFKLQKI